MPVAYLDIETDFSRHPTVVGVAVGRGPVEQLVGDEITAARMRRLLPANATVHTFNGFCFDLPVLKTSVGIDIRNEFECVDLRFERQRLALTGGQKAIERATGFRRTLTDLDGRAAIALWQRHRRGDARALATLRAYNCEDVIGLRHLRSVVRSRVA